MNHPTIKYLQEYLKSKDYRGDRPDVYFYKLVEEVGELSRALLLGAPHATSDDTIKARSRRSFGTLCTTRSASRTSWASTSKNG